MLTILAVVLPVFLVIGAGYAAARWAGFPASGVDGLMSFAIRYAAPCLLFLGVYRLDLGAAYDPALLISFFGAASASFAAGALGARYIFGRRPGESVAIGFCALFSNSLLMGVPITAQAYGEAALEGNYVILSVHAPFCYLLGIVTMEIVRSDGAGPWETARRAARQMFSNSLSIGLLLGFIANLSGLVLPAPVVEALDMVARAALPAALFALGGALTRYRLRADLGPALYVTGLTLFAYPMMVWALASTTDLGEAAMRSAVVTASMPTGLNGYVFASMYRRAQGAAASIVLIATACSIVTISLWLLALGGAALS